MCVLSNIGERHTSDRLPPNNRIRMLQTVLAAGAAAAHGARACEVALGAVHGSQVAGAWARGGGGLDLRCVSILHIEYREVVMTYPVAPISLERVSNLRNGR
jgi:hypothetical protein